MEFKKTKVALLMPEFKTGFALNSAPLGLSYIGAILTNNHFFTRGYNLQYDRNIPIKAFKLIGISATSAMIAAANQLAKQIKKLNPEAYLVIGGAHATALGKRVLMENPIFDSAIIKEGEYPMLALAESLERDKNNLAHIPNLIYRQRGKIYQNQEFYFTKNLDDLPYPAKKIFNTNRYPDPIQAYGDIIASRGCPFKCSNCKPGLDNISPYRLRNYRKVVDELEYCLKTYRVKHFTFSDSELAGPKKWVINFCQEIIDRNLKITFSCNGRTDQVDEEVLRYLKRAGCVFIGYGVESGSDKVLDQILKKGINLEQTKKIIDQTVKLGIGTGTWFMIGVPGETKADVEKSIEFAKQLNASTIEINIATPWPDTGFYKIAKNNGWLTTEKWQDYNEKNTSVINNPAFPPLEIIRTFNLFKKKMAQAGWRVDEKNNRMYHPKFLSRLIKLNIIQVLKRGLSKSDLIKIKNLLIKKHL